MFQMVWEGSMLGLKGPWGVHEGLWGIVGGDGVWGIHGMFRKMYGVLEASMGSSSTVVGHLWGI